MIEKEILEAAEEVAEQLQYSNALPYDVAVYAFGKGSKWGHQQGCKDVISKAYDWLIERYENQGVVLLDDIYELKQVLEEYNND